MAASGVHPPEAPIVRIGGGTVVNNLQYLTEKDFEYFRNKQKDGDPVRIIYLDPETLDKISFDDIDRMEKEDGERGKGQERRTANGGGDGTVAERSWSRHGCEKSGGESKSGKAGCTEG